MGKCWKSIDDVPQDIIERYHEGSWSCDPPPVCTAYWGDLSWINHIFARYNNDEES